eukprot:TRINITY_DN5276_c0_g1_i2.p1 TRINITY_DN5276_c0_g1~~TRINITY_DN5276_c0_g1_i2.p1  ORF type:complete len:439 (+),score=91.97 TRINITY_DN5276_c0_g1_i2:22-1317(+)
MSEEIAMELDALESIYGDDLAILEENKRISVEVVDPGADDPQTGMRVELKVNFPEGYPEVKPVLSVRAIKALTRAQVDPLPELLYSMCDELLGMPMVFELTTFIQEWMANGAKDPNQRSEAFEAPMVIESRVKHGTPVTRENFAEWKEAFYCEKESKKEVRALDVNGEPKLTGRQHFDKAMNTVDWELFKDGEIDEEDLPDFGDDDDEEEEEKKKGEEKPVEKTCEASSDSSSLGFDLFGSDLDDEAAPDKPHIPADHWACPACTYYNADRRPKCEICDEDKPASAEKDESDEDACSDLSSGYLSETSISDLLPVSSSSPVSKIVGCTWTVDSKVSEKPRVVFTRVNTCFEGSGTEEKPTYMAVGELVVGRATGTAAEKPLEKLDALNEESLKIREKVLKELIEAAKVELAQTSEHLASKVKSTIREATHA